MLWNTYTRRPAGSRLGTASTKSQSRRKILGTEHGVWAPVASFQGYRELFFFFSLIFNIFYITFPKIPFILIFRANSFAVTFQKKHENEKASFLAGIKAELIVYGFWRIIIIIDKIFRKFKRGKSYSARVKMSSKNKSALISSYLFLVLRLEGLTTLETKSHGTTSGAVWAATLWASSEESRNNPPALESASDTSSAGSAYIRTQLHLSQLAPLQAQCPGTVIGHKSLSWGPSASSLSRADTPETSREAEVFPGPELQLRVPALHSTPSPGPAQKP